jgi:hypothetical protein
MPGKGRALGQKGSPGKAHGKKAASRFMVGDRVLVKYLNVHPRIDDMLTLCEAKVCSLLQRWPRSGRVRARRRRWIGQFRTAQIRDVGFNEERDMAEYAVAFKGFPGQDEWVLEEKVLEHSPENEALRDELLDKVRARTHSIAHFSFCSVPQLHIAIGGCLRGAVAQRLHS